MNNQEAITLARYAMAARPQQMWTPVTPDVWADSLGDVNYEDAKAAVVALTKVAAFIDVPAIRAEVARIRKDRLERCPIPAFPGDPDDVAAELAWKREWIARIADGETPQDMTVGSARPMPELDRVLRRPPVKDKAPLAPEPRPRLREPEAKFQAELKREAAR